MGETRVDLLHLLEDLRDAYPGPVEETILSEMVANALDSRAARIAITAEPAAATITLVDDGLGIRRRELARYHDIATSAKVRGQGIGFAGVGITGPSREPRGCHRDAAEGQARVRMLLMKWSKY